ncbi:unnamed protein product [Bemisia tabaci]|uniref:Core Histone H2A/H2B/H3 domain-containing protein n=1 Tax=Bemisia tabaci TaxID=7038 RepID=A0A9P0ACM0_BEMTA|nr:unnamed protein product [Bemisia tabaci]
MDQDAACNLSGRKRRKSVQLKRAPFETYIRRFMMDESIHPRSRMSITRRGAIVMSDIISDLLEHLATKAGELVRVSRRKTMLPRDVLDAVRLVFPESHAQQAVVEAELALTRFEFEIPTGDDDDTCLHYPATSTPKQAPAADYYS